MLALNTKYVKCTIAILLTLSFFLNRFLENDIFLCVSEKCYPNRSSCPAVISFSKFWKKRKVCPLFFALDYPHVCISFRLQFF